MRDKQPRSWSLACRRQTGCSTGCTRQEPLTSKCVTSQGLRRASAGLLSTLLGKLRRQRLMVKQIGQVCRYDSSEKPGWQISTHSFTVTLTDA
jgi:hypothetical protein